MAAKRPSIPITWAIGVLFTALNLLGIGAVLAISLHAASRTTDALIHERIREALQTTTDRIGLIVRPVEAQADEIAASVRSGQIDPADASALQVFIAGMLATTPQVLGIAMVDESLHFQAFVRHDRTGIPDVAPPRATLAAGIEWGRGASAPLWVTGWSEPLAQPILVRRTPLHRPDGYYGILVSGITVSDLSLLVSRIARETGQPAFVLYDRDYVLAHPSPRPTVNLSAQRPMPTVAEVGDPILARMWDPARKPWRPEEAFAGASGHRIATEDGPVTFVYRVVPDGTGHEYFVGTYYRGSLAEAERVRLRHMALAGLAVLCLSIVLTVVVGRHLSRPIRSLAGAAAIVERQRLDDFQPLGPSVIREVDDAGRAFNHMVDGLRERQRIRDLFGKYAPNEVVEQLIADPNAFGVSGQRRDISLLFTDIAGFTTLAETMPPNEVLQLLNAYFEEIYRCVVSRGGVIVDFIGDAVFAIFGAPIAQGDHARGALGCARDIDHATASFARARNEEGVALGVTRIGVHTGIATVGNFGSSDRLKYSAAGDVVNTASRLEGANKFFGTRLLASKEITDRSGDRNCRPVGKLILKGRSAGLDVVELLPADAASDASAAAYARAYGLLHEGSPDALSALRELAAARPDDTVIQFHLRRAERGLVSDVVELAEK
ncbi:MAG TPA: adenylate/guanylate cyclase domain-containing protein [Stellaceae bacterium]|jgi:adenylate cyclase